MSNIDAFLLAEFEGLIEDIKRIALIPSPPFKEKQKIDFLKRLVEKIGFRDCRIDGEGNLVVAELGVKPETVIFSAHTDTVFTEDTKLEIVEQGNELRCPGICDNSTGIAALLFLMKYIETQRLKSQYKTIFLFNVGEEELGNLRGIRYFFDHTDRALVKAHICIEGGGIGRLVTKAVGSNRRRTVIKGPGGHSWKDHGRPNSIVIAAELILKMLDVKLPKEPKTTLNIGTIHGGTSINSIPSETEFTVEVRGLEDKVISEVISEIDKIIRRHNIADIVITAEVLGNRPAGEMKDNALIQIVRQVHRDLQIETFDDAASTDSNYPISLGIPSLTIGITSARNTHSLGESLEAGPIEKGVRQLIHIFECLNNKG